MQQEGKVGQQRANPHEGKHLAANIALDVELVLGREGNLGSNANDRGDDGRDGEDDAGHGADEGRAEAEPAGFEDERRDEQQDEVEDDAGHEEGVHDLGSDAEQLEDGDDFGGEGDSGAGQELADEDLDGVEPEEGFWGRAKGYASDEMRASVFI